MYDQISIVIAVGTQFMSMAFNENFINYNQIMNIKIMCISSNKYK